MIAFVLPFASLSKSVPTCCTESTSPIPKKRLRGRVAYDGTKYSGWQWQNNTRTIQSEIEKVFHRRFGLLVRIVGASRTDTGVHARGQAFHVDVPIQLVPETEQQLQKLQFVLNQMLPSDIRLSQIGYAPYYTSKRLKSVDASQLSRTEAEYIERRHLWSAIYDSVGKLYTYRFSVSQELDPLLRLYCHREWRAEKFGFCEARMRCAIQKFEGTHDFTAFANSVRRAPFKANPVRTIESIRVVHESDTLYRLEFRIDGALYKMIRNVVGTILDVSCFQRDVEAVDELFQSKDRRKVSKSAPGHGLCLEQVFYDGWEM